MRLLADIQKKMAEVPAKYLITDGEIRPGERVIGKLPEDLLQLYGLHCQIVDQLEHLQNAHALVHLKGKNSKSTCLDFHNQYEWEARQHDALIHFFWTAVRHEFCLPNGRIGIRAHGQVVTWIDDPARIVASTEPAIKPQRSCGGMRMRGQ